MPDSRYLPPGRTPEEVLARQVARLQRDLADLRSTMLARPSGASGGTGDSSWTTVSFFSNNWQNMGSSLGALAGWRKDASGFVHLRGLIESTTPDSTAFFLPVGYRPAYNTYFPAFDSAGQFGYVRIIANTGAVDCFPGTATGIDLAAVTFHTDA